MWSDLSTRHLLALRAVAEEGTFGRAAAYLGFTQSAVSQQIAALEAMVGQTLFERPAGPNRPTLTPAGMVLLEQAHRVLDAVEAAEREVDRFARGVSGRLTVGTFQSVSTRILPTTLQQLYAEAPGVEVTLVEAYIESGPDGDEVVYEHGDGDLAFTTAVVSDSFECVHLGEDPHVAVVGADHPPGPVDLVTLQSSPLIGQPAVHGCGALIDSRLADLGVSPNYVFRSHDNGAVQGMVGAGMGIALMPLLAVDLADPATSVRQLSPDFAPRTLSLVWRKQEGLSPLGRRFVDIAKSVLAEALAAPTASV